jgi:hypothetical protein
LVPTLDVIHAWLGERPPKAPIEVELAILPDPWEQCLVAKAEWSSPCLRLLVEETAHR